MQEDLNLFYGLLFMVAFLYASVGHGGASGYLALLALFDATPDVMRPTALVLNILVSSISFLQFFLGHHFRWQLFWPFAVTSIPLSFVGGMLTLDGGIYRKVLGILLLFPAIRFLYQRIAIAKPETPEFNLSLLIGAGIGLVSGMMGIGGGVILSPLVLLLNWANQKQTAALSAAFIFANSLSGLIGHLIRGIHFSDEMAIYVAVTFCGGSLGAYFGAMKFPQRILKNTLASLLLLAAFKLLFT